MTGIELKYQEQFYEIEALIRELNKKNLNEEDNHIYNTSPLYEVLYRLIKYM